MTTAAKISIQIDAQTATLQKGFAEARAAISNLSSTMSGSVATGMAKAHVGIAAVTAALGFMKGVAQDVGQAFQRMGDMQDFADRLGTSADALTVLGFAAEQAGASQDTMNSALEKMQNLIGEATAGSATAAASFGQLGLSVSKLKSLSADQVFAKIAEQMQGVESSTERTKIALDIFGKSGGQLNNLLSEGAEGLNRYGKEAEQMGLLLGEARKSVESAGDAINKMKRAWHSMYEQLAAFVAPIIESVANAIAKIVGEFNQLLGRGTGASAPFKEYASEAKKAAIVMQKTMKDTTKAADDTAGKIKQSFADIPKPTDWTSQGIAAVTRGSAAGFSAAQEATRARQDAERRHLEHMRWEARIERAIRDSTVKVATVNI